MDKLITRRRGSYWALPTLLIILLGFGLRLHNLDGFSLWTDEGLTPLRAGYSVVEILGNEITIQEGTGKDTHPPLYYLMIHFSRRLLGETDFAYRYPSLLVGVLLIPLLFQFGRRLRGDGLGWLAAFLTAVNPFQIWYSNEARMYALLVLLGMLTSYLLWRALTTRKLGRYLPLYLLLAGMTLYTHYTAVILIAVQGIFWAWILWQNGQRRLLAGAAVTLTVLAVPLIPYTIPRLFTGAEAQYVYVPPTVILQDIIRAFSLGITVDFSLISIQLLSFGSLGLFLIGLAACPRWLERYFLLAYLLAVPFGLMAGSLIKPMYMTARHIIIGSPAFILLVAWGFLQLITQMKHRSSWAARAGWAGASVLGGVILVAGTVVSINNLYNNEHFAKDNFRDLIQYIEAQAGDNDIVIYNDAVLLPTHAHYQKRPDLPATALPVYPKIAPDSLSELPNLAAKYDRIWFLPDPPDGGRDEQRLVADWLDKNLVVVDRHNTFGRGANVQVIAYATAPTVVEFLPANGRSLNLNWPDIPALQGIALQFQQPAALPTLWFDLFWQSDAPLDSDTYLQFTLRGADDQTWTSQNTPLAQTAVTPPAASFIRQSYALAIPFGVPPGAYTLFVEPLAAPTGPSLGDAQPLTAITLASSDNWPATRKRPSTTPSLQFQNGLTLLGVEFPGDEVRPGHNIRFTLYWQTDSPLPSDDIHYEIEIIAPDSSVFKRQEGTPAAPWLDTWPVNIPIAEHTGLFFRPEAEPGRYRLRWRLWEGDSATIGGRPSWRPWYSEFNNLGEVEVKPWPLVTELPDYIAPTQVDFGPDIQLSGYMYEQTADTLGVTLYWQAKAAPDTNYYSFVHLVTADGDIITQQGFVPGAGLRPTLSWRAGEVVTDAYTFDLPLDLPSGTHTLVVGLFDPETEERPSVSYQGQPQDNNQFILGAITLP